jgi:hypothetical protein
VQFFSIAIFLSSRTHRLFASSSTFFLCYESYADNTLLYRDCWGISIIYFFTNICLHILSTYTVYIFMSTYTVYIYCLHILSTYTVYIYSFWRSYIICYNICHKFRCQFFLPCLSVIHKKSRKYFSICRSYLRFVMHNYVHGLESNFRSLEPLLWQRILRNFS